MIIIWYENLDKNNFLIRLYEEVPKILNVRFSNVRIEDEGQMVCFSFDMPRFADNPPAKWKELEDNTVHVEVSFSAVEKLTLKGLKEDYIGDLAIDIDNSGLVNAKITGTFDLSIIAEYGFIDSVSGYKKLN
ncbi:hypothetical protein H0266_10830 [Halobacillus locisalis]|uniref:Immunity protein 50 n=1 Tax=Halobacillus locisalis TaxID=220753 RepID=A0A838CU16_9BACI|nr:Imm50 family immunity protein [Halobacillus locisalis]MBA2175388.1 hypothetical protein [Halobacillus locisalis]